MAEVLPKSPEFEGYMKWALEHGIKINKVIYPVRFPPGYIGTMATERINPGDVIVSVPNSALFTSKIAEKSDLYELFQEYDDFFDEDDAHYEDLILVTYLIWEKSLGERSKWYHFIAHQPKSETLQDWSIEELQQLQDPDAVYDAKQQMGFTLKLWGGWKKVMLKSKVFSPAMVEFSEFLWAYRLLSTRSFGKFCPYTTFAPMAEFLNHNNTCTYYYYGTTEASSDSAKRYMNFSNGEDHDDDMVFKKAINKISCKKLVQLTCPSGIRQDSEMYKLVIESESLDNEEKKLDEEKDYGRPDPEVLRETNEKELSIIAGGNETYEEGSEVYMSYGRYSNRMLLATYGFSLKDNIYNFARIKTSLDRFIIGEKAYEIRSLDNNKVYLFKLKSDTLCKGKKYIEMFRAVRALNWTNNFPVNACFSPASADLEMKVIEIVLGVVNEQIDSFPTKLEEDLKIVENQLSLRHYFAVRFI
jgi:hypothetical protein